MSSYATVNRLHLLICIFPNLRLRSVFEGELLRRQKAGRLTVFIFTDVDLVSFTVNFQAGNSSGELRRYAAV